MTYIKIDYIVYIYLRKLPLYSKYHFEGWLGFGFIAVERWVDRREPSSHLFFPPQATKMNQLFLF